MDKYMAEQLIGEIEALKALVGTALGTLASQSDDPTKALAQVKETAKQRFAAVPATGNLDMNVVKQRANDVVDTLVGSINFEAK
jgi:hypothetical protein